MNPPDPLLAVQLAVHKIYPKVSPSVDSPLPQMLKETHVRRYLPEYSGSKLPNRRFFYKVSVPAYSAIL